MIIIPKKFKLKMIALILMSFFSTLVADDKRKLALNMGTGFQYLMDINIQSNPYGLIDLELGTSSSFIGLRMYFMPGLRQQTKNGYRTYSVGIIRYSYVELFFERDENDKYWTEFSNTLGVKLKNFEKYKWTEIIQYYYSIEIFYHSFRNDERVNNKSQLPVIFNINVGINLPII